MGPDDLQGQYTADKSCICVCVCVCVQMYPPLITTYDGAMNSLVEQILVQTLRLEVTAFLLIN